MILCVSQIEQYSTIVKYGKFMWWCKRGLFETYQSNQIGSINQFTNLNRSTKIPFPFQLCGIGRIYLKAKIGGNSHEGIIRIERD